MHTLAPRSLVCAAAAAGVLLAGCGSDHSQRPARPASTASSAGAPMVVVPTLVGRRQEDAHRIVARAGLKLRWLGFVGKLGNGRYEISCVKVLSQSPVAGERRPRGASIAVIEAACHTPDQAPRGVTPGGQPGPAYDQ
jgi:hypothetical protein